MDIRQILCETISVFTDKVKKESTQCYLGMIVSVDDTVVHKCTVKFNNNNYSMKYYGNQPTVNQVYPILIPQGNMSSAFIIS